MLLSIAGFSEGDFLLAIIVFFIGLILFLPKGKPLLKKINLLNKIKQIIENHYKKSYDGIIHSQQKIEEKLKKYKETFSFGTYVGIFFFYLILSSIILIIFYDFDTSFTYSLWFSILATAYIRFKIGWSRKYLQNSLQEIKKKKQKEELEHRKYEELKRKKEFEKIKKYEEAQIKKGLEKFENKWGMPSEVKKWKEVKYGIDQNFMNMKHFEFEEFIAKLFRKMGYNTMVTRKTGDFGIDIIAKDKNDTIAIQAKQNRIGNNVGNVTVQQILGAMWRTKANKVSNREQE